MPVAVTEQDILQKPTATIHSVNTYTVTERKLMNVCLHQGKQDQFQSEKYRLPISSVATFLDTDEIKNVVWLQDALEGLVGTTITWNILNVDKSQGWGVCTVLSGGTINKGWMEYVFNPVFVEKLKTYKLWAELHLLILARLKKKHSVAMYEYGQELLSRHKTDEKTNELLLEDILTLLGLKVDYKTLNRDVLKSVWNEINQETDLDFSYTGVRTGRKVTAVELTFKRKKQFQLPLDLSQLEPLQLAASEKEKHDWESAVVRKLVAFGVARQQAEQIANQYDIDRILENILYMKVQLAKDAGKIKNQAAYLVKAIKEDYRPQKSPEARTQERRAKWQVFQEKRAFSYFKKLAPDDQKQRRQRFIDWLREEEKGLIYRQYSANGWDSYMVQKALFERELKPLLTKAEETNFERYCAFERQKSLIT